MESRRSFQGLAACVPEYWRSVSCDHLLRRRWMCIRDHLGRALDGSLNAVIRHATAERASHSLSNLGIAGVWILVQQSLCGHDLPVLTETALGNLFINPGLLDRVQLAVFRETFESG